MKRGVSVMVAMGLVAIWCGCASIVSKSTYPVSIHSSPSSAEIAIANRDGEEVFRGRTPATVDLKAGAGFFKGEDYTVTFEKPGYAATKIKRGLDGWYLGGNVVVGGFIGWLIVDPVTGAMWTLDDLDTTLTPTLADAAKEPNIQLATLEDVPEHLRSKMVRLGSEQSQ